MVCGGWVVIIATLSSALMSSFGDTKKRLQFTALMENFVDVRAFWFLNFSQIAWIASQIPGGGTKYFNEPSHTVPSDVPVWIPFGLGCFGTITMIILWQSVRGSWVKIWEAAAKKVAELAEQVKVENESVNSAAVLAGNDAGGGC
eukprot:TRINITY_DN67227_c5_g1_i1.p1 TRINITY_DN67227_c5_g1~~TRINITY_DN67227_c5_g1_i1.p1  ORF type:complete len:145 (+),score=11.85 TRINITY_DN67227_c5_g1_i1:200-634(+)